MQIELPDATNITATNAAWEITQTSKTRPALYKMVKPLEKTGIDSFEAIESAGTVERAP